MYVCMYVCINLGARGQLDSLEHLSSTVGKTRTMLPTRKPLERFTYFCLAYSCSPRILQRDEYFREKNLSPPLIIACVLFVK